MDEPPDHDLQIPAIIREIERRGSRIVGIQLPDGLKRYAALIRKRIEADTDAVPVFSTEPCYGGCDLSESLQALGCDLIVHMGHTQMIDAGDTPVLYIPCFSQTTAAGVLAAHASEIRAKRLGLVSSAQHAHEMQRLRAQLSEKGFEVVISDPGPRTEYPGQILGCNYEAARRIADQVDAFLYVGGGNFHPLGVSLATGKEVYVADPYTGEIRTIAKLARRVLHKRFAQIELARKAQSFGLLVSTKPGQRRLAEAMKFREELIDRGMEATILSYDLLDPSRLVSYRLDAYVNFGCPRIPIEDSELFPAPTLTPPELEVLLGTRSWEEIVPDEIA